MKNTLVIQKRKKTVTNSLIVAEKAALGGSKVYVVKEVPHGE